MTHDPACKWATSKVRPADYDQPGCDECDLIARGRKAERRKRAGGMSA